MLVSAGDSAWRFSVQVEIGSFAGEIVQTYGQSRTLAEEGCCVYRQRLNQSRKKP